MRPLLENIAIPRPPDRNPISLSTPSPPLILIQILIFILPQIHHTPRFPPRAQDRETCICTSVSGHHTRKKYVYSQSVACTYYHVGTTRYYSYVCTHARAMSVIDAWRPGFVLHASHPWSSCLAMQVMSHIYITKYHFTVLVQQSRQKTHIHH